jgi:ribosome-binding protein aMBF1 (putative translation factor)
VQPDAVPDGVLDAAVGVVYARRMSRPSRTPPWERTDSWPETASSDPSGETARRFALNVRDALGGLSLRAAQDKTGVDRATIHSIINGLAWPDLDTIAKLEHGFGITLWPGAANHDD